MNDGDVNTVWQTTNRIELIKLGFTGVKGGKPETEFTIDLQQVGY